MKSKKSYLIIYLLIHFFISKVNSQELPYVYDVENTGKDCIPPQLVTIDKLPVITFLPDPFRWADTTKGRLISKDQWKCRRAEILAQVQYYETGIKPPPPDTLIASFSKDSVLTVLIVKNKDTLKLTSKITLPNGDGPFPAVIGVGFWGGTGSLPADIFTTRGIATIQFRFWELAPWGFDVNRGTGGFYKLYRDPKIGFFTAWAWGVSRIIDGIQKVLSTKIDMKRLAITGCSFAGKIALFSAAFDERIALTIAQEPGGGGSAAWRVTETLSGSRETLRNAQGAPWYHQDLRQFNNAVTKLPFDHHEVMALIAPRALFVLGNPDYEWLAEESAYVACKAAYEVWKALGVPDRFGFSILGGHQHCQLPSVQKPEVIAFVEKFLLNNKEANTNIQRSPYNTDLTKWITWTTPELSETSPTSVNDEESLINKFELAQNYPNPFNPSTKITFRILEKTKVTLKVFDILGRTVDTLLDEVKNPGEYTIDYTPPSISSGTLFYQLRTNYGVINKKMVYIK
ncbi:MAG: T9SS type A sorting domain-containing protein [Melioribacter sp.]|nr:T9SS type A sorting domain-containing protein [Melioribacter sp.]